MSSPDTQKDRMAETIMMQDVEIARLRSLRAADANRIEASVWRRTYWQDRAERAEAERDAAMAGRVKVKPLAEIPVFVLIADNHDYDAMQQWLAGVFLTKEEAEDARIIEEAKPDVVCCDVHEWTMIVDTSRVLAAMQKGG